MNVLEILLSLSLSLFLVDMMAKLYGLHESVYYDVQQLSQLNRQALIARQILANEIHHATATVNVIENGAAIQLPDKLLYVNKNNLYSKKNHDFSVELVPNVKNFIVKSVGDRLEIYLTVFTKGEADAKQRIYFNHSLDLHFFVKSPGIIDVRNERD